MKRVICVIMCIATISMLTACGMIDSITIKGKEYNDSNFGELITDGSGYIKESLDNIDKTKLEETLNNIANSEDTKEIVNNATEAIMDAINSDTVARGKDYILEQARKIASNDEVKSKITEYMLRFIKNETDNMSGAYDLLRAVLPYLDGYTTDTGEALEYTEEIIKEIQREQEGLNIDSSDITSEDVNEMISALNKILDDLPEEVDELKEELEEFSISK